LHACVVAHSIFFIVDFKLDVAVLVEIFDDIETEVLGEDHD